MTTPVRRAIQQQLIMSRAEKIAITQVLDIGEQYGYGKIMGWLATEWACLLRDKYNMPVEAAIAAVSGRGPYALNRFPPVESPPAAPTDRA